MEHTGMGRRRWSYRPSLIPIPIYKPFRVCTPVVSPTNIRQSPAENYSGDEDSLAINTGTGRDMQCSDKSIDSKAEARV